MGLREDLIERIQKKKQEVRELEAQIRESNAYIQGLQDVMKILPSEGRDKKSAKRVEHVLRPNTDVAKVRELLIEQGKPIYVGDILEGIGKGDTKANRLSLSGSLGDYVRRGEVFSRPAPNTFGLLEFSHSSNEDDRLDETVEVQRDKPSVGRNEPPDNFGLSISEDSEDPFD